MMTTDQEKEHNDYALQRFENLNKYCQSGSALLALEPRSCRLPVGVSTRLGQTSYPKRTSTALSSLVLIGCTVPL